MKNTGRLNLISEVYDSIYENTETFHEGFVGSDLAYLLGAVAKNSVVSFKNEPILKILRSKFQSDHSVWKYIRNSS